MNSRKCVFITSFQRTICIFSNVWFHWMAIYTLQDLPTPWRSWGIISFQIFSDLWKVLFIFLALYIQWHEAYYLGAFVCTVKPALWPPTWRGHFFNVSSLWRSQHELPNIVKTCTLRPPLHCGHGVRLYKKHHEYLQNSMIHVHVYSLMISVGPHVGPYIHVYIHYSKEFKEHVDIMIFIERYPLKRCQGCVKLIASKVNCFLNITDLSEVQLCMSSNSWTWECPHTKDGADHVPLIFLSSVHVYMYIYH